MMELNNYLILISQLIVLVSVIFIGLERYGYEERLVQLESKVSYLEEKLQKETYEAVLRSSFEVDINDAQETTPRSAMGGAPTILGLRRKREVRDALPIMDYAYSGANPPSTPNLSVYHKWRNGLVSPPGISKHHTVSAAWTDRNQQMVTRRNDDGRYGDSLIPAAGDVQGPLFEIPGNALHDNNAGRPNMRVLKQPTQTILSMGGRQHVIASSSHRNLDLLDQPRQQDLPQSSQEDPDSSSSSTSDKRQFYRRPQLKSLGNPNMASKHTTAIHLLFGQGGKELKLSNWANRLHATRSFPLNGDKVRISTPGLYLVYAQMTYLAEVDGSGYHVLVNSRDQLSCVTQSGGSCHTAGLLYLEQGDTVNIKQIKTDGVNISDNDAESYFGLVKLTADWI